MGEGSLAERTGSPRKLRGRGGMAEQKTKESKVAVKFCEGCHGRRNSSITQESSLKSRDRAEQASSIVPSLTPPPQTVPQCSKEGCPTLVNT